MHVFDDFVRGSFGDLSLGSGCWSRVVPSRFGFLVGFKSRLDARTHRIGR